MAEDWRTRKPGRVSLHPLKFEDALRGLLKSPLPKREGDPVELRSERDADDGDSMNSDQHA
jgi:hypothetical protein